MLQWPVLWPPSTCLTVPKVRAFMDFAVPRLRSHFARLEKDSSSAGGA